MPELPEVETVVRLIRPRIVGRRVRVVEVLWMRTLGGQGVDELGRRVVGARFSGARRRGKHFVLELERRGRPAGALVGHLRMTGRLEVRDAHEQLGPWARVAFGLDDGNALVFLDVRKFGRLLHVDDPEAFLAALGPEPLSREFSGAWLARALGERRRALKSLLLDQSFVAGLGNIYVDESLHRAGLHPLARSDRVKGERARRLWRAIRTTLAAAIRREGSSFDSFYRTPEGRPGSYQHQFRVYGREGRPCRTCRTPVRRIVVGQRGTWLCPRCQPAPRRRKQAESAGAGSRRG